MKEVKSADLNSPERFYEVQAILKRKVSLRSLYQDIYLKYIECIKRSPSAGVILEIGSGGGFAKEVVPHLITSDIIAYPNVDKVMDAAKMDFSENSIACICMFNVLHHLPDSPQFFREAIRCLAPKGRIFMTEPYAGWPSSWIYKYLHHENFDINIKNWEFDSHGPVSDANNALPTVIFERDKEKFHHLFPELEIVQFSPHMPFRYWLTGGLKKWSLLPLGTDKIIKWIDNILIQISHHFGSFVDIELVKK